MAEAETVKPREFLRGIGFQNKDRVVGQRGQGNGVKDRQRDAARKRGGTRAAGTASVGGLKDLAARSGLRVVAQDVEQPVQSPQVGVVAVEYPEAASGGRGHIEGR